MPSGLLSRAQERSASPLARSQCRHPRNGVLLRTDGTACDELLIVRRRQGAHQVRTNGVGLTCVTDVNKSDHRAPSALRTPIGPRAVDLGSATSIRQGQERPKKLLRFWPRCWELKILKGLVKRSSNRVVERLREENSTVRPPVQEIRDELKERHAISQVMPSSDNGCSPVIAPAHAVTEITGPLHS